VFAEQPENECRSSKKNTLKYVIILQSEFVELELD